MAGQAWQVMARFGTLRHVKASQGLVWQGRMGMSGYCAARSCAVRFGRRGGVWRGGARFGKDGLDSAG